MKHPFDVHVGNRIRQGRRRAGLTEHELADMLGISEMQLRTVEAGAVRVEPDLMREVVARLGIPEGFLFKGLVNALRAAA